jgi:hypothetical protein
MPALPSQVPVYGAQAPVAPMPPAYTPSGEAPSESQWVRPYPGGQWVYTTDYGWTWVPAGSATTAVEGVPYAYMYTASFGWTWYLSPWGWGPYHYGGWVTHPYYHYPYAYHPYAYHPYAYHPYAYHPYGWHGGYVSHPHVAAHASHRH